MHPLIDRLPLRDRVLAILRRWQKFSQSELGGRLVPLYAALLGAALGSLVADRLVRSMWRHAIFTGPHQWRTVALLLTVLWIAIGAVAAVALLGPPDEDPSPEGEGEQPSLRSQGSGEQPHAAPDGRDMPSAPAGAER